MAKRAGPPGTARVAFSGVHFNLPWANVLWFNLVGGTSATQANFDAWVSSIGEAYWTGFGPSLTTSTQYSLAAGTLFQSDVLALHSSHVMNHVGVATGTTCSDNSACRVVSWTTGVYWRGGKPRTYIPGLLNSETTDNHLLTTAAATALQSAARNARTAFNAVTSGGITNTQQGFVSFMTGGSDRVPPQFFAISDAAVHKRIGSQRRRLGQWVP